MKREPSWNTGRKPFLIRLALAYITIPLITPALLTFGVRRTDGSFLGGRDYLDGLPLLGMVTLGAMLVPGLPLLLLYLHLKLTSLGAFAAGGVVCAMLAAAVLSGPLDIALLAYYGAVGVVAGLIFRVILFGVNAAIPGS